MANTDYTVKQARKVAAFVEDFFAKSGDTEFPTIAQVSKATGITQARVAQMCDDNSEGLMQTAYNVSPPMPRRDCFVERV